MSETKLNFKLVRPAKSSGGDRYEYLTKGNDKWMVVYIPQSISRGERGGSPVKELNITISTCD